MMNLFLNPLRFLTYCTTCLILKASKGAFFLPKIHRCITNRIKTKVNALVQSHQNNAKKRECLLQQVNLIMKINRI